MGRGGGCTIHRGWCTWSARLGRGLCRRSGGTLSMGLCTQTNSLENVTIGNHLSISSLLFVLLQSSDGSQEEVLYSYTIITVDASPALGWLHNRMPVGCILSLLLM